MPTADSCQTGIMRSSVVLLALVGLAPFGCSRDSIPADGVTTTSNDDPATGDATTLDDDSTTSDDTDSSDSTSILMPDDTSPDTACDPFAQDCPEGEKCVPYASTGGNWDANKCVPITGDKQPGETCSYGGVVEATDDCDASSHCWDVMNVDGELMGVCTPFCKGSPDDPQCPEMTSCLIANEGTITLCVATCDPVAQDCPEGMLCVEGNPLPLCIFTGGGDEGIGMPCDQIAQCPSGTVCMSAAVLPECPATACCAQFCSLEDPSCLQEGAECVPFLDELPPGYEDVGVCIIP